APAGASERGRASSPAPARAAAAGTPAAAGKPAAAPGESATARPAAAAAARPAAAGAPARAGDHDEDENEQAADQPDHQGAEQHRENDADYAARGAGAEDPAEQGSKNSARHDRDENQRDRPAAEVEARRALLPGGRRQRLALDRAHDPVDTGADAAVEIALLEARRDVVLDDAFCRGVGQHAFEAIADLELQFS